MGARQVDHSSVESSTNCGCVGVRRKLYVDGHGVAVKDRRLHQLQCDRGCNRFSGDCFEVTADSCGDRAHVELRGFAYASAQVECNLRIIDILRECVKTEKAHGLVMHFIESGASLLRCRLEYGCGKVDTIECPCDVRRQCPASQRPDEQG